MHFHTYSSPHGPSYASVSRVMAEVLLAMIPGIIALTWYFGWGVLINLVLATAFALGFEALTLMFRSRPVMPALGDLSAVVTAWLFAVAVPPIMPWWMTLVGMFIAIVIVKQLYGGLGYNPFNPAMAAYVFLLVSFMMDGKASLARLYQYEDATARMSVEQVDALADGTFEPVAEMQSLRYTESAYWFRLKRLCR